MKFIFPQNYNLKSKIFGFIEYQSAILDAVWICIILCLVNIFFSSLNVRIFLFIVFVFPVLILSIVGINGECVIDVLIFLIKYFGKQKVILYEKEV